ncbi:MAG: ATP-binding protein [Gammaproteobacteria bacterium]|nr:ATP-binding protein [Gammaproteobacteria bacterium]
MPRRMLPIGIQTFRDLRERGCYYVDKTNYLASLVAEGKHYFLSRPRRFGKSLLVDTLKELFEGNEPLFRGTAIHDGWDWSVRRPVVRLDFSNGNFSVQGNLESNVMEQLAAAERRADVATEYETVPGRFASLLETLAKEAGQAVAVLVDEYDKPMLDALDEPALARANRGFLRGLYSTIKFSDAHIAFTLFTGVTKFSKVSLFSDLNNLIDITLEGEYSALCGYTDQDIDTVFGDELPGLDRDAIRDWYNGYHWLGEERVYNPYDILLLFRRRRFGAYWFETATPSFLVDTLLERSVATPDLDRMVGTEALLSTFDIDRTSTEALLFQTGYLTIKHEQTGEGRTRYRLGYPNREVRQSLNEHLLNALLPRTSSAVVQRSSLHDLLQANDFEGLESQLRAIFAAIPHQWHTRNEIASYEGYYASVVYSCFAAEGFDIVSEDSSSRGRADMTIRYIGSVYVFEFKVVDRDAEHVAIAQLRERGYADKYRHLGVPIHLIGVEFSRSERNLAAFDVETA